MSRGWLWLQLAVAWLPMWALFTALIVIVHGVPVQSAAIGAARMIAPGALLGVAVYRFTLRAPWPHPFRIGFIGVHVVAAILYAVCWFVLVTLIDSVVLGRFSTEAVPGIAAFLVTGAWLYIIVAGVAYANRAAQRTAQLEAHAARAQLAELRAQLHPHFLFNALHTVVQLIPADPKTAMRAAEQLAAMLRVALEEKRDLIPFAKEMALVEQYLAIERIRCGGRLVVAIDIDANAADVRVPSFSLQTLVENAVRHAVAPRIEPTRVAISARMERDVLQMQVIDDGAAASDDAARLGAGTGLKRLRERLRWLYGDRAFLDCAAMPSQGFRATLRVPVRTDDDDE